MAETPDESAPIEDIAAMLVANHRDFLAFVEKRVGNRAIAEEILQDAFVRSIDKLDTVRDTAVGWFYRVLRNAIIDHYRRNAAAERRHEAYAQEEQLAAPQDEELHRVVCTCVAQLAETLKPEYAAALRRVEVDGISVKDYAHEAGISSSNAGVRIFRAREALRKQVARSCGTCATHGCVDCTCDEAANHRHGGEPAGH
jgi:RNA polymerase sigma factor (sigma-70 family)